MSVHNTAEPARQTIRQTAWLTVFGLLCVPVAGVVFAVYMLGPLAVIGIISSLF